MTYTYYAAGNLKTRADATFGTTTYTYDHNTRLTGVQRPPDHANYSTTIVYDGSDNRTKVSNAFVSSTFGYDGANRLTSRSDAINGRTFSTTFTPDGNDNLQELDYPSGLKVTYVYDSENRVTDVRSIGSATPYASGFEYHPSGARSSFTAGDGLLHTFTYTSRYRVDALRSGVVTSPGRFLDLDYGYDDVGNVTSIADDRPGLGQILTYDGLDRLKTASGLWSGTFDYDTSGNRRTMGATTYTYDGDTARLTSVAGPGADSFTYDANGNLKTTSSGGTATTFTYTAENMVDTVTANGILTTTYRYDGDQARTVKIQGTRSNYYIHGPKGEIVSEFEEPCSGSIRSVRDYVYAGEKLIASVRPAAGDVTVGFELAASTVPEAAGTQAVWVTLTTANGALTACPVSVSYGTPPGTAVAGMDFTATSGTFTFGAGTASNTRRTVSIPIVNDNWNEQDETFAVQLSNVIGAALGTSLHTITILDNDPVPTVSITPSSQNVTEGNVGLRDVTLTVSLSAPSGKPGGVSVDYAATSGTAQSAVDYLASPSTLNFPAEDTNTSKTLTVQVTGDTLVEADEDFTVGITMQDPAKATVTGSPARVVILNDDTTRPPAPPFSDFNRDGQSDLLWHKQTTGELYVWLMSGTVAANASYLNPDRFADTKWQIRGLGDFNGDGKLDILWHHQQTGDLYVWMMDGTVVTTGKYLTPSRFTDVKWQIRGVADFDRDGKVDVLWHHQQTGDLYVWLMGGTGADGTVAVSGVYLSPSRFADTTWQIRGVTDLNADGQVDILWHRTTTGELYAWCLSGTTVSAGVYPTPRTIATNWQIRMVADFNGDDQPDILWQDKTIGDLYVWHLDTSLVVTGGGYLTPKTQADSAWWVVPK